MQRPGTSHSQKINEQIRKQLLPRTDKLKEMFAMELVPESNERKIIIPCLEKTLGFKTNQYIMSKGWLEGYITRLEFNGFVRKCNKIVEEEVILKTKKENQPFFGVISTLLKVSIVIAILTFFLLATIVFFQLQSNTADIILILAGVMLASASMIAVVCPIVLYNSKYTVINYEESIKSRLETLVNQQNQMLEKKGKRHLSWQVQKNFFWIQLNIDHDMYQSQKRSENHQVDFIHQSELASEDVSADNFLKRKLSKGSSMAKQQLTVD